jgi:hypothetical protein
MDSLVVEIDTTEVGDGIKRLGEKPDKYSVVFRTSDKVFWIRGYKVAKTEDYTVSWHYLDNKKKPINYIVWISKELK